MGCFLPPAWAISRCAHSALAGLFFKPRITLRVVLSGPCLLQIKLTPRQAGIKSRTLAWLVSSVFFPESFKHFWDNEEVQIVMLWIHLALVAEHGWAVLVEGATVGLCHSRSSLGSLSTILSFLSLSHRRSDVWSQGLACDRQSFGKLCKDPCVLPRQCPVFQKGTLWVRRASFRSHVLQQILSFR